jgi:enamine deaminase RidA (YjgF/YER057c/UK114 family)
MSPIREDKELVLPAGWMRPRGYSQGIVARGRMLFVAGQVGWNPETEEFESSNFVDQVRQVLENVIAVLRAAGAEPHHLVRMTWFITDPRAYNASRRRIGEIYSTLLGRHYPPMSVLVVTQLLEKGAKIEIEATAVIPDP